MQQVLVIDDDPSTLGYFDSLLRQAGYLVHTASSGTRGVDLLMQLTFDCVITDLDLADMSGIDILRQVRREHAVTPVFVVSGSGNTRDAVAAMRLGATDYLDKPVDEVDFLAKIERELANARGDAEPNGLNSGDWESHAVARWARAVVPLVKCPKDPRTIRGWGRWVAASPGALRNWCRTAGIPPRRSLVFGRMLRAAALVEDGRRKPANLLDVVDRRTLTSLMRFAGFDGEHDFPADTKTFLERQMLVRDPEALAEVSRVLENGHTSAH